MSTSIRGLFAATLLAGSALAATPALAQDDSTSAPKEITVTGSVALTSDYRFRGVSLSGGDPAIQGGITVSHKSGFYVGVWSSSLQDGDSVDLNGDGKFGTVYGEQELDAFGGWTGEVTSGLTLDVGLLEYIYPSGHEGKANYFEPYASIAGTMGPAKVKVGVAYAWDQKSLGSEDNLYVYGNVDIGIPHTPLTVSGHLGYTDGVLAPPFLAGTSDDSGFDYSIGASATIYGPLSLSVSYIGVDGPSIDSFTDDTVVATLTATF
jgi:uncharacterized protein (TIGR02001 family)